MVRDGDTEGILVLSGFCLVTAALTLWGLHMAWYKKTVRIDEREVLVQIRTLWGTTSRTTPLETYEAVVQMDSRLQWWKFSCLLLPDPDPRFSVCLAMTPRGSSALPELHDHFAKLLELRKETTAWKTD